MSVASPVDVVVNPNNTAQRYILWGNGRIDNIGGAPAITSGPSWYDRLDQPVGVALWITDWATGKGYVLDCQGGVTALNGAPVLGSQGDLTSLGLPYYSNSGQGGHKYVDWSWDPSGSGHFVVVDAYGQLYAVNGANAPSRTGARWGYPAARKLQVNWSAGQPTAALTMDWYGGLQPDYGASAPSGGPYWPGWDAARDLVVTDWTGSSSGYVLDLYGGVHEYGSAVKAYGGPYQSGSDVARCLAVISASNPASFLEVWSGGQLHEWSASSAPTVSAGGVGAVAPPSTVTDTTRPTLAWAPTFTSPDSQAAWQLYVYTSSFASANDMSDPSKWVSSATVAVSGIDPAQRAVVADYDFPNGNFTMYVRVQNTAGLWSSWANRAWTQNVPAPATPTGLSAMVDTIGMTVSLRVSAATGSADTVAFGCSDDNGATWSLVRGADAVTLTTTVTAVDYDAPLGGTRTYRAVAYNDNPRVVSSYSNTVAVSLPTAGYWLTAIDDATLGGLVQITDAPQITRTAVAGVFQGVGAHYPIVVSDGAPKANKIALGVLTDQKAEWDKIKKLVDSNSTLVLRTPFGEVFYCRPVGDIQRTQIKAFPDAGEPYPVRHLHKTTMTLVEISEPLNLDLGSTIAPGPSGT